MPQLETRLVKIHRSKLDMELTVEETGLEVLDLRTDAAFATRNPHSRDIGTQMPGLQRLSRAKTRRCCAAIAAPL